MRRLIGKKAAAVAGIILAVLGLIGVYVYHSTTQLAETAGWAAHVHLAQGQMDELAWDLHDAEAGRCAYLLSGEARYRAAHATRTKAILDKLRDLGPLLTDSPGQRRRFEEAGRLIRRRLELLHRSFALRQRRRIDHKGQHELTREGREVMEALRVRFAAMKAEEGTRLERWQEQARDGARRTIVLIDVGNLVAFAVVGGGILFLRRDLRAWERGEDALRDAQRRSARQVAEQTDSLARSAAVLREQVARCRQLEDQFRQAQKMEALGRLAGGVAHDFNNLLTVILTGADVGLRGLPPGAARESLAEVRKAGEQAAVLTRQILTFIRPRPVRPCLLSLNAVVEDMETLVHCLTGRGVEMVTDLEPGLPAVRADRGQLEQVVLNLAVNARDAMPGGGRLLFETRTAGDHVVLRVADTGVGMDEATQARVFEPFFSTKGEGKGTGLGLTLVQDVVRQCGGDIRVESTPGQGTAFLIRLPTAPRPGAATILLVSPGGGPAEQMRCALVESGYTVLHAADGREALRLAREHRGLIHLLVTDPDLTGAEGPALSAELTRLHPGVRTLYLVDGPTLPPHLRRDPGTAGAAVLPKPYLAEALGPKVRELLGG